MLVPNIYHKMGQNQQHQLQQFSSSPHQNPIPNPQHVEIVTSSHNPDIAQLNEINIRANNGRSQRKVTKKANVF